MSSSVLAAATTNPVGTKGVPRAAREQQILGVAVDEFVTRGYAGASMVEIAARAGISKPLIYQYFGSKDGLYLACLHQVTGAVLERLEKDSLAEDDTVMSRVNTLRAVFEALAPQREAWKLMYDPSLPDTGDIAEVVEDYRARTRQMASSGSERFLLARGLHSDLDTSALSHVWMGLVDSLVMWWIDHPEESADDMVQRCARLMAAIFDPSGIE